MAPFDENGQFRFENEFDDDFPQFLSAIKLFHSRGDERDELRRIMAAPEFRSAYKAAGEPPIWPEPELASQPDFSRLASPVEKFELISKLQRLAELDENRELLAIQRQLVENVLAEYRAAVNTICITLHYRSVNGLIEKCASAQDPKIQREILCSLIELDPLFLNEELGNAISRKAYFDNDRDFFARLAKALDPNHKSKAYETRRQKFALTVLSQLGYKSKPYTKWAGFFKHFNEQLGEHAGLPREAAFLSFEQWGSVKEAIRAYGIPKEQAPPGRKKSK